MNKTLLGLAALLIGVSIILPWATMSWGTSETISWARKRHTSSHARIFPWGSVVQTSITNEVYRVPIWDSKTETVTIFETSPFQSVVSIFLLLGLILVLIGFKDRRMGLIGGVMAIISVGYFLYELPNLGRSSSVIVWPQHASVYFGYIPTVLGAIIAIFLGFKSFRRILS